MEEMKENERKEEKRRNWKWLILIPIIIAGGIGMVLGYQYMSNNQVSIPITLDFVTTTPTETTTPESYMVTGNTIIEEQVTSEKIISLKAGRYNLAFNSDNDVTVSLRKNPSGFFICCNTNDPKVSGVDTFDVNSGADGDYLLKIEGTNPVSYVTISQLLAF